MTDLATLTNIFSSWMVALNSAWEFFNTPIADILDNSPLFIHQLGSFVLNVLKLGDFTPIEFMLGIGLAFYLVYQLIVWLLNLMT